LKVPRACRACVNGKMPDVCSHLRTAAGDRFTEWNLSTSDRTSATCTELYRYWHAVRRAVRRMQAQHPDVRTYVRICTNVPSIIEGFRFSFNIGGQLHKSAVVFERVSDVRVLLADRSLVRSFVRSLPAVEGVRAYILYAAAIRKLFPPMLAAPCTCVYNENVIACQK
jgi:hypothetical protein